MEAYQTDNNGYLVAKVKCQPSPLEKGKFLVPGGAITDAPPEFGENQIPRRVGNRWEIVPNYSGRIFYHKLTRVRKIFELGEEFDSDYTDVNPIENERFQKFENGGWTIDLELKLNSLRDEALLAVKNYFNYLSENYRSTVTINEVIWDSGKKYLTNIDTLLSIFALDPSISIPQWRSHDNNFHSLTIEQLTELKNEIQKDMYLEGLRLYAVKWQKENEIKNLTIEEIEKYNPMLGWEVSV